MSREEQLYVEEDGRWRLSGSHVTPLGGAPAKGGPRAQRRTS